MLSERAILIGPVLDESFANFKKRVKAFEPDEDDLLIAVDGGLDLWKKLGIRPDLAVGDWDSLQDKKLLKKVDSLTLPVQKDWSDLYFALNAAAQAGSSEIICLGLTGGRADHQLASLMEIGQFAAFPGRKPGPVMAFGPEAGYFWVGPGAPVELALAKGSLVSIFAIAGIARDVELSGFEYEGEFDVFAPSSMGLSNQVIRPKQTISVAEGAILVMVPRI